MIGDTMSAAMGPVDLSLPKSRRTIALQPLTIRYKNGDDTCVEDMDIDEPLNLSLSDKHRYERDTTTPPKTPTTPNCTSFKKNILKRYSKCLCYSPCFCGSLLHSSGNRV